jgi:hypothetical protein
MVEAATPEGGRRISSTITALVMKGWKGVIQKVGFWRAECMLSGRNLPFPDDWAGACILHPLMEVRVCLTVAETTCLEESRCIISGIFQAKKNVW